MDSADETEISHTLHNASSFPLMQEYHFRLEDPSRCLHNYSNTEPIRAPEY